MIHQLNEDQLLKAKIALREFKQKRKMWEQEYERSVESRKKASNKYYKNINENIQFAQKKVEEYDTKIKQFEQAIKNKRVEIE